MPMSIGSQGQSESKRWLHTTLKGATGNKMSECYLNILLPHSAAKPLHFSVTRKMEFFSRYRRN